MGITVIVITHQMSVVEKICNRVSILDGGVEVETGSVTDIFANPQSDAAKRLVMPDMEEQGTIERVEGRKVIAVSFNDAEATDSPLIASLAMEKGIAASILFASTKSVGGRAFGKMLLGVPDEADKVQTALEYMNGIRGIAAQVVEPEEVQIQC